MKSLDSAIASMKSSGCVNCRLENATDDKTGEEVYIEGSFCSPGPAYDMIQITAYSKSDDSIVWEKECETGKTCSIPFSSNKDFDCY